MRTNNDKIKFLEELKERPLISIVCGRTKIAKATIYRWRKEDKIFDEKVEESLSIGRDSMVDMSEGILFSEIRKGNMVAVRFFLENNSKRYHKPKRPIEIMYPKEQVREIKTIIVHTTQEAYEESKRQQKEEEDA
ncbi:MAG: hypothetical protein WCX46_01515 [Candidatus Paceibacterota bacterium]